MYLLGGGIFPFQFVQYRSEFIFYAGSGNFKMKNMCYVLSSDYFVSFTEDAIYFSYLFHAN